MRARRLSDNYASLIFKYCDEHPDFTKKHFDASDAIARRGYRFSANINNFPPIKFTEETPPQ